jgi:hypothetical protein
MASRVVTNCKASFGTAVLESACETTVEIALKDSIDSFPPVFG